MYKGFTVRTLERTERAGHAAVGCGLWAVERHVAGAPLLLALSSQLFITLAISYP